MPFIQKGTNAVRINEDELEFQDNTETKIENLNTETYNLPILLQEYFKLQWENVSGYGAFLGFVNEDIPLFIDPYLIKISEDKTISEWKIYLSRYIKEYLGSSIMERSFDFVKDDLMFGEIPNTNFGVCSDGNRGRGLGESFAKIFYNFFNEASNIDDDEIDGMFYLEMISLYFDSVGKDKVSDMITNILHYQLCEYTEKFALKFLKEEELIEVEAKLFDFEKKEFITNDFDLPHRNGRYLLIVPKSILVKDNYLIDKKEILNRMMDDNMIMNEHLNLRTQLSYINNEQGISKEEKRNRIQNLIEDNKFIYKYYYNYNAKQSIKSKFSDTAIEKIKFEEALINYIYVDLLEKCRTNKDIFYFCRLLNMYLDKKFFKDNKKYVKENSLRNIIYLLIKRLYKKSNINIDKKYISLESGIGKQIIHIFYGGKNSIIKQQQEGCQNINIIFTYSVEKKIEIENELNNYQIGNNFFIEIY